jgi:hypothetical protein
MSGQAPLREFFGVNLPDGRKWGPIFRGVNETAADSFLKGHWSLSSAYDYAAYLSPQLSMHLAEYEDLQFWSDHPEHFRTHVTRAEELRDNVNFTQVRNIASVLHADPATLDPELVSPGNMPRDRALLLTGHTGLRFQVETLDDQEVGILEIQNERLFGDDEWHRVYSEALALIYVDHAGTTGHWSTRNGRVFIDGEQAHLVKANLSIYADHDIRISNHIVYNDQHMLESGDKLGLVSRQDIIIDWNKPGQDLFLQAGMIATSTPDNNWLGRIRVDQFNNGVVRGKLYMTGSLVGRRVNAFGMADYANGGITSGFLLDQAYDRRFLTDPPPFTPTIGQKLRFAGWH